LLYGKGGDDVIGGGDSADIIFGGEGNDIAYGGTGNDKVNGDDGNDTLLGNRGNDELYGGAGNDSMEGGDGNDHLDGGQGDDVLNGGVGFDIVHLDGNHDEFIFAISGGVTIQDVNTTSGVNDGTDALIDIERLSFSDGFYASVTGNDDRTNFDFYNSDNIKTMRTVLDSGEVASWEQFSQIFDASGDKTQQITTHDNGFVIDATYVDGVRRSQVTTDSDDIASWNTIEYSYDPTGDLTREITRFDDSALIDRRYDPSDEFSWEKITVFKNTNDQLTRISVEHDNGRIDETEFVDGIKSKVIKTDVEDAHNWSVIESLFDDDGNLISTTKTFDDGSTVTNYSTSSSQEFANFADDTYHFDLG
jgi:hypothetical protein